MKEKKYCGIDVSAKTLCVHIQGKNTRNFDNTEPGHRELLDALQVQTQTSQVFVCLEATGIYGLDIATKLASLKDVNVMVANPRSVNNFSKALMKRSKTDLVDAEVLYQYAERMPFTKWKAPTQEFFQIRAISRRIRALKEDLTAEKCRLHASISTEFTPDVVTENIQAHLKYINEQIKMLQKHVVKIIASNTELKQKFNLLISITGFGELSALYVLADLIFLPADMDVKQWVAYAGLDPRKFESGSAIQKTERISKNGNKQLRHALFLPALVALKRNEHIKAFFKKLVLSGKKPKQAVIAIMRKFLHAIFGMFKHNQNFDATKSFAK